MFDALIINGTIIDGSGRKAFKGDIGINQGKITAIGDLSKLESNQKIDAAHAYVCPGFFDVHTHSDMTISVDGRSACQVRQGVTTQIGGLCGASLAPLTEKSSKLISKMAFFACTPTWHDFKSYMEEMNKMSLGTNMGSLVGHGTLRLAAMENPIATPSEKELQYMVELLDESIQAGAFGLSTGLEYNPGKASEMSELEALCHVVSKHNALHTCHTRNRDKYYVSAICEAIDITRATGARLQISHINPKYGRHDSTMQDLIDMINHARQQGFYVAIDVMTSEWNHTGAMALMPLWAQNVPTDELISLLSYPEGRAKLKQNPSPVWQLAAQDKWDRIYQFGGQKTTASCGMSIAEIAKKRACSGWDAVCQLLMEEAPNFTCLMLTSDAFALEDILLGLQTPYSSATSDAVGLAKDGPFAGKIFSPNTYDWIPTFFKNFVLNDKPALSLEEAIQKVTSIPAMQVGINNRGLLYQGYCADITILRPEKLKTFATLKNPCEYPEGIQTVLVNGKIAYQEGDDTIHCHGKPLIFKGV